jgi:protein tyrosine phosphatase (PTP) superfamily phosphohydrolase (DUF442 family)
MTIKPQRAFESALLWGAGPVSFGLLALFLYVALASTSWASHPGQALAPVQAESSSKLVLEGVPNFGRVTETLYRGGQPTEKGFQELRGLGIEIVVNFRDEPTEITAERREVELLGLRYVSLPWNSWHRPQSRLVADFLALMRANAGRKIFVHCHRGADRTGVMVALFRIALQNWTPEQAIAEMQAFHFHRFLFPHLKSYVRNFPQAFSRDPSFRSPQPKAEIAPRAHQMEQN